MTISTRIIPFIPGDGIGPEIMDAARRVVDASVYQAYEGSKKIDWIPFPAGKMAFETTGSYLPDETIKAIGTHKVGIKGPLTTPIGGGIRSLNVDLRQALDLYVCLRPVRWLEGLPSPLRSPQGIDLAIFRENTEDLYAGLEYEPGTPLHLRWMQAYSKAVPEDYKKIPYPEDTGVGIKLISKPNSQRLVHAALQWALDNGRKRVTLAHKGNIMKYTEGSFLKWGYQTAETAFSEQTYTRRQHQASAKNFGADAAEKEKI